MRRDKMARDEIGKDQPDLVSYVTPHMTRLLTLYFCTRSYGTIAMPESNALRPKDRQCLSTNGLVQMTYFFVIFRADSLI